MKKIDLLNLLNEIADDEDINETLLGNDEFKAYAEEAIIHTYNRFPVAFDHGEGVYLYDTEGKKYLDFGAGIQQSSILIPGEDAYLINSMLSSSGCLSNHSPPNPISLTIRSVFPSLRFFISSPPLFASTHKTGGITRSAHKIHRQYK